MAIQERAERTRLRLIQAAAEEFALNGYGATSLQRISDTAGLTMGALTFHFPTKIALAGAVHAQGSVLTREAVTRVAAAGAEGASTPPLQRVVDITQVLARLLHEEVTVRAAGRLSREHVPTHGASWNDFWLPSVRELLEQASSEGELPPGADPQTLTMLTRFLISGLEEAVGPGGGCPDHLNQLGAVWDMVLSGTADRRSGSRGPAASRRP